jgi:hypothetical protein
MANPAQDVSFNNELSKIPGHILIAARQDMNLGDKDPQLYTPDEKVRATR